jgi:hypothetical protein
MLRIPYCRRLNYICVPADASASLILCLTISHESRELDIIWSLGFVVSTCIDMPYFDPTI